LLDPNNLSRKILERKRQEMGSYNYSAQMLQAPEDSANAILKPEWVSKVSRIAYEKILAEHPNTPVHFIIDGAYTDNPTAMVAVRKIGHTLFYQDALAVHEEYEQLINTIRMFAERNGATRQSEMHIENKASGLPLISTLKGEFNTRPINSKDSKIARLMQIQAEVSTPGLTALVEGHWNEAMLGQIGLNNPPHDDLRDIFVWGVEIFMKNRSGNFPLIVFPKSRGNERSEVRIGDRTAADRAAQRAGLYNKGSDKQIPLAARPGLWIK
jgi:phage terminase large subunit-like protein